METRWVYMNGSFVSEKEAKISIFDSALMFGDMVFEMTRSFNKKQFKLREHLERLYASIKYFQIPLKMTLDELEAACHATVEKNEPSFDKADEHRLMINVSRGPLGIYADVFEGKLTPTVIIADFPLKWTVAGMGQLFDQGINAVVTSQRALPADLLDPKVKNRSRVHYMMANMEASNWRGDNNWALLLDPQGFVAEGSGDNFLIVKDGAVISPEPRNILRGISRDYVIELCAELGIPFYEKNFGVYDVVNADEAFMTATPFCMLPVTGINSIPIGNGKVGPVFGKIINKWSANVGLDIQAQIKEFSLFVSKHRDVSAPTPYSFKK